MVTKKIARIIDVYGNDVEAYEGYQYTRESTYSARVANERISVAVGSSLPHNTKTVIDIGCGDGTYTAVLASRFPAIYFSGFDPTHEAIDLAKKRFQHIHFFTGDLFLLPPPKKRFDVAILRGVIHHIHDPILALKKARLWARRIIIVEPNGNNILLKCIEKVSPYHRIHRERSFNSETLEKWCTQANITFVKQEFIGFVPFFFPTFFSRILFFCQPYLEKIPVLSYFFSAQIVIVGEN